MRVRHRSYEASVWNCPTPPRSARRALTSHARGDTNELGAGAPRGRRGRGPRADLIPARALAVLLRHRLRGITSLRRRAAAAGRRSAVPEARLHMGRDPLEGLDVAREILAQQHPGLHRARADTGGSSHHGFTSGTTEFGRKLP